MSFEIIDADGHVTETWEQIARHLDEPYRKRPLLTPLFPQDGWDRRLMGTKGNWAGDGKSWLEALAAGGVRRGGWGGGASGPHQPQAYKGCDEPEPAAPGCRAPAASGPGRRRAGARAL